jgi:hypothetical protein
MANTIKENATHISQIKGRTTQVTSDPENQGVAGLREGDVYYRTDISETRIRANGKWWGKKLTTTSTSTS